MRLEDAIEKARGSAPAGYMASAFAVPKGDEIGEWTLLFYNPSTRKVTDCFVNEQFVTIGEELPAQGEMKPLDAGVKVSAQQAIAIASKEFDKNAKQIKTSLLSLHTEKTTVWTVSFVAADFTMTRIDIDAQSGAVLEKKSGSLLKRL